MSTLPDGADVEEKFVHKRRRMEFIIHKKLHFWNRWLREYLTYLHKHYRVKRRQTKPIKEGEIVPCGRRNGTQRKWRFARVERLIKGSDDIARGHESEQ